MQPEHLDFVGFRGDLWRNCRTDKAAFMNVSLFRCHAIDSSK